MNMYVEIMISGYMLLMLFFFKYLNKRIRKKQVSDSYLGVLTEIYKTPAVKFSHELVDSIGFRINYLFYCPSVPRTLPNCCGSVLICYGPLLPSKAPSKRYEP